MYTKSLKEQRVNNMRDIVTNLMPRLPVIKGEYEASHLSSLYIILCSLIFVTYVYPTSF